MIKFGGVFKNMRGKGFSKYSYNNISKILISNLVYQALLIPV